MQKVVGLVGVISLAALAACRESASPRAVNQDSQVIRPSIDHDSTRVTFNRDVAPIVWGQCAGCHRPNGSGPFSFLSYSDVRKHSQQIVDVTETRYMPPWLPEPGYGEFLGQRRLGEIEIETFRQWVQQGAVEGDPADLPELPAWSDDWHLGKPDLILAMPEPYTLAASSSLADGSIDVYRNFVIPTGITETRWVKAIELRPGNDRLVHHALVLVDPSRTLRRLDQQDTEPGFEGMELGSAQSPGPHFLSWQPGRLPSAGSDDLAWRLDPRTDLVLQLHLQPSGKPEPIQAQIGLHFTEAPPPSYLVKICLRSFDIDIPAGKKDYEITAQFRLPVDAEVLAVLPHAHYLGKRLEGTALLPDGTKKPLILIKDWDFNWQSDYRYRQPVFLPAGTVIEQRYTYDNSPDNARNPHTPPQRVHYGPQSTDEMGELWIQLRLSSPEDLTRLQRDYGMLVARNIVNHSRAVLREDPGDRKAHFDLGKSMLMMGKVSDAVRHLRYASQLDPDAADIHYYLALGLMRRKQTEEAFLEFYTALQFDEQHFGSHHGLGLLHLGIGDPQSAEVHFQNALRISPLDPVALSNLGRALLLQGKNAEAAIRLQKSLEIRPDHAPTRELLKRVTAASTQNDDS